MRILIFHGYLLDGTGSNVYNARLAQALVRLGHEVHLLTQDRHPERQSFVGATGDWDAGRLVVRPPGAWVAQPGQAEEASPAEERPQAPRADERSQAEGSPQADEGQGRCVVYRPDIGGLLPVYVQDRYEGMQALTFAACSDEQVAAYVQANVEAVREVAELVRPQAALANHLVMGPAILARALGQTVPYAVKVHGSALEYTVKPEPERFLGYAREGLAGARTVLVGSHHTAASLWEALRDPELERRTRLGPPGVDIERFAPRGPADAQDAMRGLAERLGATAGGSEGDGGSGSEGDGGSGTEGEAGSEGEGEAGSAGEAGSEGEGTRGSEGETSAFARDDRAAARAVGELANGTGPLVAFVGKLIVSKGVDLLVACWPLVLRLVPDARLAIVGFGAYRKPLERMIECLGEGDLEGVRAIAMAGRSLESAPAAKEPGGQGAPLGHLLAFLDSLGGQQAQEYRQLAQGLGERIVLAGRLDHDELVCVLPACEALVVPSTFPEAFGMVAAEAAACGVLPVSAGHSGLAEVSAALAGEVPAPVDGWLSFPLDDDVVRAIAARLCGWLSAEQELKARARAALVSVVRARWSWEGVAHEVIAAAHGEVPQR